MFASIAIAYLPSLSPFTEPTPFVMLPASLPLMRIVPRSTPGVLIVIVQLSDWPVSAL